MSRARLYAQLVRLPNLPSAFADILLGALATEALPSRWLPFAFLLPASGCLYCAGMVWNDFFDVQQDLRERPFRPIASGKVSRREAALFGGLLLFGGVILAGLAGLAQEQPTWLSGTVALGLVFAILLYDSWLKRTPLGPIGMGACRFLMPPAKPTWDWACILRWSSVCILSASPGWHAPKRAPAVRNS
jgi:4-hydroxybenzoate polyprenyltransferase